MKFKEININNFRQYYGNVFIDLATNAEKNIVLIGGRNGYGKTNLLLSIVWCLYGDKISQVDDNFKREIQKEKNYSLFMKQSINWSAQKENKNNFSTELNYLKLNQSPQKLKQLKLKDSLTFYQWKKNYPLQMKKLIKNCSMMKLIK